MPQLELQARRRAVLAQVLSHVERRKSLLVLKAPPGSGKTYVTLRAVALGCHLGQRVAVATQTHAQADDFCRRLSRTFPEAPVVRFASRHLAESDLGKNVNWAWHTEELPTRPTVVVSTTAKWGAVRLRSSFDTLCVDEAWQMSWADLMLLSQVAPRFVLVGDPGQIAPVVSIDVARWQTSRRPPHLPAPKVILQHPELGAERLELPVTTRLPFDSARLVRPFYDFDFEAWARPGERQLRVRGARPGRSAGIDGAIDLLTTGSVALLTVPTPKHGPPLEEDAELAGVAALVVRRLLERQAWAVTETGAQRLRPEDIGVAASHRAMNSRLVEALGELSPSVSVDTPERWQGLERQVMVVIHPLSGVLNPSAFDLATGRLCVMASRHRVGLILISRDHLGRTLEEFLPAAEQALGLPDEVGRGHAQHLAVWQTLKRNGRIV
jgi:hypothetical protein